MKTADVIGLVLAGEVLVLSILVWLVAPALQLPSWAWAVVYVVLAPVSWHVWQSEKWPVEPEEWIALAVVSVFVGGLFFGADVLIGSSHGDYRSLTDAAAHSGGPFGIFATLVICPGLTMCAVAGAVRARYAPKDNPDA
jgi:hypothetical protein